MKTYNLQLYDHLLSFQLFQGLSRAELLQMAGNTKFGFMKLPAGKMVAREADVCRELLFLISGSMELTTRSADGAYTMHEQVMAPWAVQPEALFGAQPRYSATWRTTTPCHFIKLQKDEVLRLTDDFLILRLNLFNMLSTLAQRHQQRLWHRKPQELRQRFILFVLHHSTYPAGTKVLHILMTRLAHELGDSRLHVSVMLHELQAQGLLLMHRGRVEVPSLERLLSVSNPVS